MSARRHIIPIFVPHLGCPNDCVFCNQRIISGSQQPATSQTVYEIMSAAICHIPTGEAFEVAFYGGSFTAIPEREQEELLLAVLPFLRECDSIRMSTRPDCVDEKVISRLERYNVTTVELGAQSMGNNVLQLSGRGHTAEDTARASKLIKSAGISLILQMMTGLPGDTPETAEKTARSICSLKPDGVRIYPTVIVKNTELYNMWRAGLYQEHTVEDAVELCARLVDIFEESGIPIIRLGLNPTEDLSGGDAVGGAYHPALGELVYSRRYLNRVINMLDNRKKYRELKIGVNRRRVSLMIGQKKCNINALKRLYSLEMVKVVPMDIQDGEILIL